MRRKVLILTPMLFCRIPNSGRLMYMHECRKNNIPEASQGCMLEADVNGLHAPPKR